MINILVIYTSHLADLNIFNTYNHLGFQVTYKFIGDFKISDSVLLNKFWQEISPSFVIFYDKYTEIPLVYSATEKITILNNYGENVICLSELCLQYRATLIYYTSNYCSNGLISHDDHLMLYNEIQEQTLNILKNKIKNKCYVIKMIPYSIIHEIKKNQPILKSKLDTEFKIIEKFPTYTMNIWHQTLHLFQENHGVYSFCVAEKEKWYDLN